MSLKKIFNAIKDEGIVLPRLNKFLLNVGEDEGRNHGYNSPSGVSSCPRSLFYTRTGEKHDGAIDPRTRRIFDNGHHVHARLQGYLLEEGVLLMDECPVWNTDLRILGHCDGILRINKFTLGILEIKSINSNAFSHLTGAKPEHQMQAQVYMYCLEKLREKLQDCVDKTQYKRVKTQLLAKYAELMDSFVEGGSKFTKEEKIAHKVSIMEKVMEMLYNTPKRIEKMSVVYENKDNQEIKEYVISWDEDMVEDIVSKYEYINEAINSNEVPPRPDQATSKSCSVCRYCNYTYKCWK